jgi:uncharacterized protein
MLDFIARLAIVSVAAIFAYPITVLASDSPPAVQQMEQGAANKAIVETMLKAWMAGDGSALLARFADDIEWTITGRSAASGTTHGRSELMAKVLGPFSARFTQSEDRFRPRRIHGVYAEGGTVIAYFDGAGIANGGQAYSNTYLWLLTLRDGKIVRGIAFFDSIAFDDLWNQAAPARN